MIATTATAPATAARPSVRVDPFLSSKARDVFGRSAIVTARRVRSADGNAEAFSVTYGSGPNQRNILYLGPTFRAAKKSLEVLIAAALARRDIDAGVAPAPAGLLTLRDQLDELIAAQG